MNLTDLKEKVKEKFPNVNFLVEKESKDELILEFETDNNKDYSFYISSYLSGFFVNVGAKLKNSPGLYFWCDSIEQLNMDEGEWSRTVEQYLFDVIQKLVNHKTRIIQTKGILYCSFTCEYLQDSWKTLTKNRGSRLTLEIPKIDGRRKIYG
ncbi:MAG: hypothetical protein K8H85_08300 [Cyclobacteriaceae bacterium]|nr:hypothetical protein [Cyclobacteriaceae bacterium]